MFLKCINTFLTSLAGCMPGLDSKLRPPSFASQGTHCTRSKLPRSRPSCSIHFPVFEAYLPECHPFSYSHPITELIPRKQNINRKSVTILNLYPNQGQRLKLFIKNESY